jgi:hypothetical protein
MTPFEQAVLDRLQAIDEKIEAYINPCKSLEISEKARIMKKALATGDKKIIREAGRRINGE